MSKNQNGTTKARRRTVAKVSEAENGTIFLNKKTPIPKAAANTKRGAFVCQFIPFYIAITMPKEQYNETFITKKRRFGRGIAQIFECLGIRNYKNLANLKSFIFPKMADKFIFILLFSMLSSF